MINTLVYHKLRIAEFIQFMKQALAFVKDNNPKQLGVQKQYAELETQWDSLAQLFKKATGANLTEALELADERRDKAITGLGQYLESLTYHYDDQKVEAAKLLLDVIGKYGRSLARLNYQEESAILSSIVKDWERDKEAIAAMKLLNATDWKEELKTANGAFDKLYRQRAGELAQIPDASASELREPVMEAYRVLTNHLTAHSTLHDNKQPYDQLIGLLNEHTSQYNQLVKNRYSSSIEEPAGPVAE